MGGKTQGGCGGITVMTKRRAVLGIGIPARNLMRPALPQTRFTVGDRLSKETSKPQFSAIFAEFKHLFFRKTAERVPFGWIRHKAGLEKCPNRPFWMADRLKYGLG
jgi:hypothetical protein